MTLHYAELKSRIVEKDQLVLVDGSPFSGTIHRKSESGNSSTTYYNGQKHGVEKLFYENGGLKSVSLYNNGLLDGRCILYWPCGTKKMHLSYKNGLVEGTCEEWNQYGVRQSLKRYYHGKLVSINSLTAMQKETSLQHS